jgi:predicted Zn-dependent peptidase
MYKKETLTNGFKTITSNMPHMESVSVGIWIGTGGRYEKERYCGMSHLIEHMLFKGTHTRNANMLKEAIEGVGGSFNGFTTEEVTCFLVKLPAAYLEKGLDILSDMVLHPLFDPGDLEKEKSVICEEIKMYRDQPAQHIFDVLAQTMWPRHALGRPILGYDKRIATFTRDDLEEYRDQFYQPANMTLVTTGRIDRKKCLSFARDTFSIPSRKRRFSFEKLHRADKSARTRFVRKDTEQTHIAFGFHSISRTHRLRYAVELLNVILGGNMSSRLFDNLRDRKGLCYDISSSTKKYRETGAFIIHAGVDNNMLYGASKEIVKELKEIKENLVRDDELSRAKEYYKGQLLLTLEDTASRMIWLGVKIMNEGKAPSVKAILEEIESVDAGTIREAADTVFNTKNMSFTTIGPAGRRSLRDLRKALTV